MKRELVCISCPRGCLLTVEQGGNLPVVRGNRCSKGENYGITEVQDPRRVVTATVRTNNPEALWIPVKTDAPLPKGMIRPLLEQLRGVSVPLPVRRGQVIVSNFNNSGVNIICTRSHPLNGPVEK